MQLWGTTFREVHRMDYDTDKVDEMVLALLCLTMFPESGGTRAWKGHAWGSTGPAPCQRLHFRSKEQGQVSVDERRRHTVGARAVRAALRAKDLNPATPPCWNNARRPLPIKAVMGGIPKHLRRSERRLFPELPDVLPVKMCSLTAYSW